MLVVTLRHLFETLRNGFVRIKAGNRSVYWMFIERKIHNKFLMAFITESCRYVQFLGVINIKWVGCEFMSELRDIYLYIS